MVVLVIGSLNSIGVRRSSLSEVCQNSLRELGVIKRRRAKKRDWISSHLVELYSCNNNEIWIPFLGSEYEHALHILIEAKARYKGAYSEWLSLQDSLNDIITRKFIDFLHAHHLPGHQQANVTSNDRLVHFGVLIQPEAPLDSNHPAIFSRLRTIHIRRNQLPGSHPYDERGGTKNTFLQKQERNILCNHQKYLLNEIINFFVANRV